MTVTGAGHVEEVEKMFDDELVGVIVVVVVLHELAGRWAKASENCGRRT
jgi:hypothetical protein